jgi:hypothetical protein
MATLETTLIEKLVENLLLNEGEMGTFRPLLPRQLANRQLPKLVDQLSGRLIRGWQEADLFSDLWRVERVVVEPPLLFNKQQEVSASAVQMDENSHYAHYCTSSSRDVSSPLLRLRWIGLQGEEVVLRVVGSDTAGLPSGEVGDGCCCCFDLVGVSSSCRLRAVMPTRSLPDPTGASCLAAAGFSDRVTVLVSGSYMRDADYSTHCTVVSRSLSFPTARKDRIHAPRDDGQTTRAADGADLYNEDALEGHVWT